MRYKRKHHTYKSQSGGSLGAAARQLVNTASMAMARILPLFSKAAPLFSKIAKPTIQFARPIAQISKAAKPIVQATKPNVLRSIAHDANLVKHNVLKPIAYGIKRVYNVGKREP